MAYCTRSQVEQYLNADLSAVSGAVTEWIASVKAWIDRYCGRSFEAGATTKYYDGNRLDRLEVDSFVGTPTSVKLLNLDGTTWATLTEGAGADYVAYPLNSTEKTAIVLMPNAQVGIFARTFENLLDDTDDSDGDVRRLVEISASFGASTNVPDDVRLAAIKLVAAIAQQRLEGAAGPVTAESLGDYSISHGAIDEAADALGVYNILDAWRDPQL